MRGFGRERREGLLGGVETKYDGVEGFPARVVVVMSLGRFRANLQVYRGFCEIYPKDNIADISM